jgi:hypothetical protein
MVCDIILSGTNNWKEESERLLSSKSKSEWEKVKVIEKNKSTNEAYLTLMLSLCFIQIKSYQPLSTIPQLGSSIGVTEVKVQYHTFDTAIVVGGEVNWWSKVRINSGSTTTI